MKDKRSLWVSLLSVVAVGVIALTAALSAGWSPKLGLDLAGGLSVVYETHTPVNTTELDTIITILNDRVGSGSSGATVSSQGTSKCPDPKQSCALIGASIPGQKNTQQILNELGKTAQLFFRPALCFAPPLTLAKGAKATPGPLPTCNPATALTEANLGVNPDSNATDGYTSNLDSIKSDAQFTTYRSTSPYNDGRNDTVLLPGLPGQGTSRYVLGPAGLTGAQIKSATAQLNSGQWSVDLTLTGTGATEWDTLAQKQFHAMIGIDLDGQVISAPLTQPTASGFSSFDGSVQISGGFSEDQAKALATELNYGALPVKLDQQTVQTVSPSLGKSSLQAGLISGLIGLALVMIYTIFYYRVLGLVIVSGLALTGALLWSIIAFMGQSLNTTIDLAGVIGIIVSIGITVDSYIIYFERLKDEARSGRTVRTSVDRGFKSAFRTVLAADLVSFLGALILYKFSIGPVQGFALFLGLSTVLDVFVTYFFTRPFVILLGRNRSITEAGVMGVASGLGMSTEGAR
ncbi:MAG: protein translocase subunit SecD [Acidimicrobiales bacterium]|jgi:preprotein translocase subunit SecD